MAEACGEGVQRRGTVLSVCFMAACVEQGRPSTGTWSERPRAGETPVRLIRCHGGVGARGRGGGGRCVTRSHLDPALLVALLPPVGSPPRSLSLPSVSSPLGLLHARRPGCAGARPAGASWGGACGASLSARSCLFTLVSRLVVDWAQEAVPGQKARVSRPPPPPQERGRPGHSGHPVALGSAAHSRPGRSSVGLDAGDRARPRAWFPMRRCLRGGPAPPSRGGRGNSLLGKFLE